MNKYSHLTFMYYGVKLVALWANSEDVGHMRSIHTMFWPQKLLAQPESQDALLTMFSVAVCFMSACYLWAAKGSTRVIYRLKSITQAVPLLICHSCSEDPRRGALIIGGKAPVALLLTLGNLSKSQRRLSHSWPWGRSQPRNCIDCR